MNQSQLKYARERVSSVFNAKKAKLRVKFTTPAVQFSAEEKLAKLRAGDFTLEDKVSKGAQALTSFVNFGETFATVDTGALDAATATLTAAYQKLMDTLVLGDSDEALALIASFEQE